jgi:HAD superfamily hydrolase (TIGR01509 family)
VTPTRQPGPAVLFDMDGTLVDSEKLWDVALHELAARLGGALSRPTRVAMIGSTTRRSMLLLHEEVGLPTRAADGSVDPSVDESGAWLENRVRELFDGGLRWRAGAAELVAAVRAAGLRTGLVTATRRSLVEIALRTLGRDNFDVLVCGDDVSRPKPDPEPYLTAAGLLGVPPAACVAIEDSATGSASAEAAGCAVLVVPSEAPVPGGPRRVQRESLVGVTVAELLALPAAVALR